MTPEPTAVAEVPWALILGVVGAAFTAFGTLITFLVRSLFKSTTQAQQMKFDALLEKYETLSTSVEEDVEQKFAHTHDIVLELSKRVDQYFGAHERLRDKWNEFLTNYLKIDSTRGQKIDALFRVVDQMQEAVKDIRPSMKQKIEESFSNSLDTLKLYVRDAIAQEKRNG